MNNPVDKIKIFCSYSHSDASLRKKLDEHLNFLKRDNDVVVWFDGEITAGSDLNEAIKQELNKADVILLLISSSFLNSFYCYDIEMKRAMERHGNNEVIVVPVLLSDCVWQDAPFAKLLMTPYDAKPINNPKHWTTIDEALTNVALSIRTTINLLKEKKANLNEAGLENIKIRDENESDNDVLLKAIEVLKQSNRTINYNSTKEDLAKALNVKSKIFEELFDEIDSQIEFISSKKELMYSSVLFDKIYTSEKIDSVLTLEIQKIREKNDYKWYDRSVIVSALTLSLMQFKFDEKKANLLLDFVTDFEPKVWQRALTGLTISILYQKNRGWLRASNFVRRLSTLKNNQEIQDGLKDIDYILKNELYKSNLYNPNLYKNEFFNIPMNCFVPFYENNEVLTTTIDNVANDSDFDANDFQSFINNVPLIDSSKYSICLGLDTNKVSTVKIKKSSLYAINTSLRLSFDFNPFQNLISEIYFFFENYPSKLIDDVLKKQLLLSKTELKNYVLNKITQLLVEANTLYQTKEYTAAINKYLDLLRIDKNHLDARWQLGNCYIKRAYKKTNDVQQGLNIFLNFEKENKIENKISSDALLEKIAIIYFKLENWEKSLEYCNSIKDSDAINSFSILCLKAENYKELEKNSDSEKYCIYAEEKAEDEDDMCSIARIYLSINKFQEALRMVKKALETKPNDVDCIRLLGEVYFDLFEWNLSIEAFEKAFELKEKSPYLQLDLGRAYLFSGKKLPEAKKIFEKLISTDNDCTIVAYGNLAHFYLIEKNLDKAFEYYSDCLIKIGDADDFNKKMKIDLKFILKAGVEEYVYENIRQEVIDKNTDIVA